MNQYKNNLRTAGNKRSLFRSILSLRAPSGGASKPFPSHRIEKLYSVPLVFLIFFASKTICSTGEVIKFCTDFSVSR